MSILQKDLNKIADLFLSHHPDPIISLETLENMQVIFSATPPGKQ